MLKNGQHLILVAPTHQTSRWLQSGCEHPQVAVVVAVLTDLLLPWGLAHPMGQGIKRMASLAQRDRYHSEAFKHSNCEGKTPTANN